MRLSRRLMLGGGAVLALLPRMAEAASAPPLRVMGTSLHPCLMDIAAGLVKLEQIEKVYEDGYSLGRMSDPRGGAGWLRAGVTLSAVLAPTSRPAAGRWMDADQLEAALKELRDTGRIALRPPELGSDWERGSHWLTTDGTYEPIWFGAPDELKLTGDRPSPVMPRFV